jgi:hypothetical protein
VFPIFSILGLGHGDGLFQPYHHVFFACSFLSLSLLNMSAADDGSSFISIPLRRVQVCVIVVKDGRVGQQVKIIIMETRSRFAIERTA